MVRLAAPQMMQDNMLNKLFWRAKWHLKCSQEVVSKDLQKEKHILRVVTAWKAKLKTKDGMYRL